MKHLRKHLRNHLTVKCSFCYIDINSVSNLYKHNNEHETESQSGIEENQHESTDEVWIEDGNVNYQETNSAIICLSFA